MFRAFLTGSRKYGIPSKDSDADLVVYMTQDDYKALRALSDDPDDEAAGWVGLEKSPKRGEGYDPKTCSPLRFGKLNLIVCTNTTQYACWIEGTEALIKKGYKVTRDEAVKVFTALRRAAGLQK